MVGSGKDTYGYRGLKLLSQRSGSNVLISVILFPNAEGKYAHITDHLKGTIQALFSNSSLINKKAGRHQTS